MKSFWENLKRRHVFQVAAIYLIVGWLVAQVTVALAPALLLPGWFATAVVFLVILGFPIALVLAWAFELTPEGIRRSSEVLEEGDKADPKATESRAKPSIAVMPFENLSDDQSHEFLADGMTEDILTGLAYNSSLEVTSRNATMVYKNAPTDLREVGRALGVRYVLEGSLRQVGDRIRVTAQLIEAATGNHLWAEKYDRPKQEIFDVQDEVIEEILGALDAQIVTAELSRARHRPTDNLNSWELMQKAYANMARFRPTKPVFDDCVTLLKKAVELDPNHAVAHSALCFFLRSSVVNGYSSSPEADMLAASEAYKKGLSLEPEDPVNLKWLGMSALYGGEFSNAIHLLKRSLDGFPNDGAAIMHLGLAAAFVGDFNESQSQFARAYRVAPSGGLSIGYRWYEGQALAMEGRYAEAEEKMKDFLLRMPDYSGARFGHAVILARLGRIEEAREEVKAGMAADTSISFSQPPVFLHFMPCPEGDTPTPEILKQIWPKDSAVSAQS